MTPRRMDLRRLSRAGAARRRALEQADAQLDVIAEELEAAGELANITLACKLGGIPKTTIYRRLAKRAKAQG